MVDTISFGKAVLKQLKVDERSIEKLFAKSDNAVVTRVIICHRNYTNFARKRYDYNEHCKGKGQCSHECAGNQRDQTERYF